MTNPYNAINPLRFIMRRLGIRNRETVFVVEQDDHTPLAMCVFRDHLVRFLSDELEGDWGVRNLGNNIEITLTKPFDIQRVRDNFRMV